LDTKILTDWINLGLFCSSWINPLATREGLSVIFISGHPNSASALIEKAAMKNIKLEFCDSLESGDSTESGDRHPPAKSQCILPIEIEI
jgi:hypothetical protein